MFTRGTGARHFIRDSQGRTRTERLITRDQNGWSLSVIEIRDPVEGVYCILAIQKTLSRVGKPNDGSNLIRAMEKARLS